MKMRQYGLAIFAVAVGAVGGMTVVPDPAWAPPAATPPPQPVVEQNLDAHGNVKVHEQGTANVNVVDGNEPYSVHLDVNAGNPQRCKDVPLPAGDLLIAHVEAWFTGPTDAFLLIPVIVETNFPGNPTPGIGWSQSLVLLEGLGQNLTEHRGRALGLGTTLLVQDGFTNDVGRLFRDADNPVQFCAEDESQSVEEGGDAIISGSVIR